MWAGCDGLCDSKLRRIRATSSTTFARAEIMFIPTASASSPISHIFPIQTTFECQGFWRYIPESLGERFRIVRPVHAPNRVHWKMDNVENEAYAASRFYVRQAKANDGLCLIECHRVNKYGTCPVLVGWKSAINEERACVTSWSRLMWPNHNIFPAQASDPYDSDDNDANWATVD